MHPSKANPPRVGIMGFFLECNRFAPPSTRAIFAETFDLAGEALGAELGSVSPKILPDTSGFMAEMNRLGAWEPVPLRLAGAQPGGPAEAGYFNDLVGDIEQRLQLAGPLDAVFICAHGAALTETEDDPEGVLFERVRAVLGAGVPVVAVMDLHANVSARMANALSAAVVYRTNPHVDLRECGEEAARHVHAFWQSGAGQVALVKLPLVPPATSQIIAPGTVYHRLMQSASAKVGGDILNVSLCGGFALADAATCGFSVLVTSRAGAGHHGQATAQAMAEEVWAARHQFVSRLWPLADAVAVAVQAGLPSAATDKPWILADVGDNPGGGGGGNTVTLIQALLAAQVQQALVAVFTDAGVARQAFDLGVGARFEAHFNDPPTDLFGARLCCPAQVVAVSDGKFVGRRGLIQGVQSDMGCSARLDLGGVQVVVISKRQQLIDPAQLDALSVDLSQVRVLVAKSRGHYRAAFDDFTDTNHMIDVDCPGLTTPNLKTLPWTRMPRPIFPIDDDVTWSPAASGP